MVINLHRILPTHISFSALNLFLKVTVCGRVMKSYFPFVNVRQLDIMLLGEIWSESRE